MPASFPTAVISPLISLLPPRSVFNLAPVLFTAAFWCLSAGIFAAEPTRHKSYYLEPRGHAGKRDPDPPAYTLNLSQTDIEVWKHLTWLDIGLDTRFRYEYRDDDARRPGPGRDEPLLFRTRAYLGIRDVLDPLRLSIELQDSRRYNSQYTADNRDVNEFDLIQLQAELYFKDALGHDPLGNPRPLSLRAGRMNFEFLDRRLLGNNQWRNTANSFQGFRAALGQDKNDWQLDLLAVQPLRRLKYEFDEPATRQWLYAAIGHWRGWSDIITLEPYYLCLNQAAGAGVPERQIHSPALRGYGLIGATGFDYDFDIVGQFGRSGAEKHRAFGFHTEIGRTFQHSWMPRLSALYTYASGDKDPNDHENNRFERFFGFSRPLSANDFMVWENLHAAKSRVEFQPHARVRMDAAYMFCWLASSTDRWPQTGLRDRSGASGSFIGREFDLRARVTVNKHLETTLGYAHFTPGEFSRNLGRGADADFFYLEFTVNAF